jgi:hypothetical protein
MPLANFLRLPDEANRQASLAQSRSNVATNEATKRGSSVTIQRKEPLI